MIADAQPRVAALLREWRELCTLNLADLAARLGRGALHVDRHTAYGRMGGLVEYHHAAAHAGRFYFLDEQRPSVLAYFADIDERERPTPAELEQELGAPAAVLRSRAGKSYRHAVYPQQGLAYSADAKRVAFIEIFPPTTLADYQERIHDEPEPFVR